MDEPCEFELPRRYHEALTSWQHRNFEDLPILLKHWPTYFPAEAPYRLAVKLAPLKNDIIETGAFRGQPKLTRASDMKGNMLFSAVRIVRAQCSTELGSIQQHLATLDNCITDQSKFSILRIMAEELRHAYQMFWVLCHDHSWTEAGVHNLADQTMDELLTMTTGSHVLDAFNIPFHDALDNVVFAFLIDRVGKYQLSMQKVFSYAPMAQSMVPMLHEESFHLRVGHDLLRDIAVAAATGDGRWNLAEIQKRINAWFPRAIEMFGNPEGGQANVTFGFKDRLNGESAQAYVAEVARLIRRINVAIVQARRPDLDRQRLEEIIDGNAEQDLLRLPHSGFFRLRGPEGLAGHVLDVDGRPVLRETYLGYLEQVLPGSMMNTEFFRKYAGAFVSAA